MNLPAFLEGYPKMLFSEEGDAVFVQLRLLMHGMCSARVAKLLNFAARFLGEKECYLEIGTYAGFTLLSAGYESHQAFIGVDNFSENYSVNGDIKKELMKNIQTYPGAYYVIDGKFQDVDLKDFFQPGAHIGIFLIDGKHTFEEVMASVLWARPYLADEALLVFDDVKVPGVKQAVEHVKKDPAFDEIFFAKPFFHDDGKRIQSDSYIHNGFSLMTYRKENVCQN